MKRCMAAVILLLIFFLNACNTSHEVDTEKDQQAFLQYSLGEYTAQKESCSRNDSPIPHVSKGYQWTASYTDDKGDERSFIFNNMEDFGSQLWQYTLQECTDQAQALLLGHFLPEEISSGEVRVVTAQEYAGSQEDFYLRCIDAETGIKLQSITARELHNDWGIRFSYNVRERNEDEGELAGLKSRIEGCMWDIFDYFDDDTITVLIDGKDTETSCRAEYDEETEQILWQKYGDFLDRQNTIDGRLQNVRLMYVGDELFVDADLVWHESTGEYHIDQYYVQRVLGILGVEIEDIDTGAGIHGWQIGSDEFIMNRREGTITRNGENIIGYRFDSVIDINLSVFEEMTGTQAWFDEESRAVYVDPAQRAG